MLNWLLLFLSTIAVIYVVRQFFNRSRGARHRQVHSDRLMAREPLEVIDTTPDLPTAFGYKMCWLAIRSSEPQTVLDALPMEDVQRANWRTGFLAAYRGHTFVSPSVNGWVFVVSYNLPELGTPEKSLHWTKLMKHLSERFEDVQYFGTHRIVEYHAWARFVDGIEQRAFAYVGEGGETLADRGEKTAGELELGHNFFDERSPDAASDDYWDREDLSYPNEADVMEVAGVWSINPVKLGQIEASVGVGWIGAIRRDES